MSEGAETANLFGSFGRPRYGKLPFPPYSYVPGFKPHPASDPAGHMRGAEHPVPPPLDPSRWAESPQYVHGVDLFNHGYYWEAHEAWESQWHAAGRRGPTAGWLKCLIKLAAAGVKVREGNPRGVQRHADRALQLLDEVPIARDESQGDGSPPHFCGIDLKQVRSAGAGMRAAADDYVQPQPSLLLPWWFRLRR